MTPYWDVVPARARRLGVGERSWFPLVLLLGLVGGLVATAHGLVPTGGLGGPGPAFVGLAGLAAAGGDDDVSRLVEKIERFQTGEDVDFESDREDDVGALYDAVGSLAASAAGEERSEQTGAERELERHVEFTDAMLDAVDDVFFVRDEDGYHQRWNETLTDVLGYSDEEIASMHALDGFPEEEHQKVSAAMRAAFETGNARVEATYLTRDGERIPYEFVASALEDPDGNRVIAGIGRDISERKEYERRLGAIVENTTNHIYIKDRDGAYEFVNEATAEAYGLTVDEMTGMTDAELFDPDGKASIHALDQRVLDSGENVTDEIVLTVDGEPHVFLANKFPYRDDDGEVVGVLGISQDITERKENERRLERTSARLEALFERSPDMIDVLDTEGTILDANERLCETLGYTEDELTGTKIWEHEREFDADEVQELLDGMAVGERRKFEGEFERADGSAFPIEVHLIHLDLEGKDRFMAIIRDITERKEREAKLERQATMLDSLFEQLPVNIYVKDEEGRHVRTSTPYLREDPPGDEEWFQGKTDLDIYPEELARKTHADDMRVIEEGEPIIKDIEYDLEDEEWLLTSKVPWRNEDGEIRGLLGYTEYITEQKERERELRETKRNLELVLEGTNTGTWEWDLATGELTWNETLERLIGVESNGAVGSDDAFERCIHPDDISRVRADLDEAIENDEPYEEEFRLRHDDGHWVWVSARGRLVFDEDGRRRLIGIMNDITERKEREEQLRETRDRLTEHNRTLRRLYEISADREASFDEKIQQLLELGRERLGTSGAFLSTIHEADNEFEFTHVDGALETIRAGLVVPFSETYCRKLVETGKIFDVNDALAEGWEGDPAYERWGLESYFGSALYVEGELAGTLSFVDEAAHDQPLTDDQRTFVELAAQWMSYELERRQRERQLERYREYTDDVLDAIDDVFYVLDEDGELQRWNDSLVEVTGYSHAQVGEMHALDFFPEDERRPIAEETEEVFETGDTRIEAPFVTKDGERIPHEFVASTLEDPDGNAVLAGIGRDVTERKARERELRETKRRLELALEGTNTGIWEWNRETDETVWNETFERMMGLEPGEFEGTYAAFERRVHPDDLPHVEDAIERAVQNDDLYQTEFRLRHEDGRWIWLAARGQVVDDGDGGERMVGINYDITERKRREAQVRERERELERYHEYTENVLDAIDDVFYLVDEEWNLKRWNESLCEVTGYTDEEIAEMNARSFFAEDDAEQITTALGDIENRAGVPLEADLLTKAGESIPFEFVAAPLNDPDGNEVVAGIGRDISERVEKERQLSRLIDNVPGYVYRSDAAPPWQTQFVSEGVRDISGYEPADLESGTVNWDEDVIADRNEELAAAIQRAVDERESFHLIYPIDTADGERRWVKEQGRGVYAADGSVTAIEGVVIDVTEQRVYEQELERTSQLLEKSQRIAEVGGWTVDMEDGEPQRTQWTERMFDIFELSDDEAPFADEVLEFYHPEDRAERRAAIERAVETGEGWDAEARIITAAGNERWVRTAGEAVVEDGEVVRLHGAVQDVTEQKEREVELERTKDLLQQAGRIAQIGGWELDLTTDPPEMSWTDELYGIHGVEPGTDVDVEMAVGLYHPEDRKYIRNRFQSAIEHGEGYDMEVRLQSETGRHRWVRALGEPVYEDGEVVKLRGSIQDVTDQKEREQELRETKDRLQQFIETSPVGVVAVDPDETVTLWNEGMEQIFGWSEDEVLGKPYPTRDELDESGGSLRQHVLDGGSISQAELERETKEGDRIDISVSAAPVHDAAGNVTEVVAFIEDITERKERERELERTKDMLAQAQELAGIGGWELDLTTEPPALTWTDELYRIHGLETGTDVGLSEALDFYHPEDRARISDAIEQAIQTGRSYDEEVRLFTADGEQRWVRTIGRPVREDGDSVVIRGSLQDITTQKERELALESLHEATRGLLHTESEREVADLVVETATSLFDLPGVAVYTIDEESNRLVPTAYTDAFEELSDGAPAVGVSDDTAIWNCFATGGRVVFDDAESARQSQVFGDDVDSGLLVPMGDHGVFVVATDGPRIGDETRRLAETLVATTEAAFDRLASEADLRQRDAELEAQNQRLRRQIQITDIIRRVDQSLVGATSREEVESAVCDRLVESEDVAFAWIGGLGVDGDELVPRVWAGTGETYLDTVALDDLEGTAEPAMTTARTGEATVVGNVVEGLREDAWRRGALANDFHSVVSVPLAVDDYDHGVLAVYADEPGVFGDLERAVFAELGQSIANAINAVSAREALHSDTVVELTLEFDDPNGVLARVAAEADCEVEYEGISTRSADETRLFFATTGATADAVADVLDDLYAASEFRLVDEGDDGRCLFEATITGPVLPSALVDQGASPRSIRATPTGMEAVVDLPTSTNVRQFVETLREQFPTAELASRRNVERGMGTRQQLLSSLMDELTDRQLEVLRTAYFAGFFEWPRASTGEEVAEMLDVTQPTVNRHLRLGQQRLLAQLFDEEAPDLVAA